MSVRSTHRLAFEEPIFEMEKRLVDLETRYATARAEHDPATADFQEQIRRMRRELSGFLRNIYATLDSWQTVQVSRHPDRPQTRDYLGLVFDRFLELHGDRAIGDDKAIVTGFAHLGEQKVMFIGQQKGKNLEERMACHFGCAHPEGYRKALLKMRMAEKLGMPIICFIDTPGAYPGISAEERGQAAIIAENLMAMSMIKTPIVCVVIGEGGSGGALGIGIGDKVSMLEHGYYSVISPEGCAAILWKHREHAPEAASALKLSAQDLSKLGIIDGIIPEPLGGAHNDHFAAANSLKDAVLATLKELNALPTAQLLEQRYQKFRALGQFTEG